jgi:Protein of unknown function (DUF2934)
MVEFAMITLFWVFIGLMVASSLAVISLTIVDVLDAHRDPHSDEGHRLSPRALSMSTVDTSKFLLPDQKSNLRKEDYWYRKHIQHIRETKEEIRRRAYELYQLRGSEDGHDLEDWLRAELEVRPRNLKVELVIDGAEIVAP